MTLRSAKEIWEAAKGALQVQVNRANYETWLKDTVEVSYKNNLFIIGTPSVFAAEWLEKRLYSLVKKTLISITGENLELQFQVYSQEEASPLAEQQERAETSSPLTLAYPQLNPKYTFDTFIVGSCNRLAHAASLGVAENPGKSYNPLFVYGGVGRGKTHLLQAIGHVAKASGYHLVYVSTEQFTNEFINAIKDRKMEEFRNKFRSVDLLLIDDIHFISGKEQTQEGFFHTFNDLHNANRQIVISSDRPPKALPLLEERLRSRFDWGLLVDIAPPDLETRIAILRAKAEQQRFRLDEAIMDFIARRIQRNIRELEGCLNRLVAFSRLTRKSPCLEMVEQAIQDLGVEEKQKLSLSPNAILDIVCQHFHLSRQNLLGSKRNQPLVLARQIAMYLLREETSSSSTEIGQLLGGRDHSTVLHGYEKIARLINTDPTLRKQITEIKERLYLPPPQR